MQAQKQRLAEDRTDRNTEPDVSLLVRRAQAGDRAAFEEIYRLHVDRIHALCLRLTADRDQALLRTQDAFVKAWLRLSSFRGNSRLITWLHRLTVNVIIDRQRSLQRDSAVMTNDTIDEIGPSPARHDDVTGLRLDLESAIATLPERARMVFVLHDVEGYRLQDVAELMGTAVGTTKAQLHRARRLLRKVLKS